MAEIEAMCPVLHVAGEKETLRLRWNAKGESGIARAFLMVALDPTNRSVEGGRICHMKQ